MTEPHSPKAKSISVTLTVISDGDTKTAQQASITKYGINQDADFKLLQESNFTPQIETAPITITINQQVREQQITGFGAALTDSSACVLMGLKSNNKPLYYYTLKRLFIDSKISVLRISVGACDYTSQGRYYTYCDTPGLQNFSTQIDEMYVVPALKDILELNPNIYILASPWSAPAWMKTTNELTGSLIKRGALKPECFEAYADYWVKFLLAYRSYGINVRGITLQNEPQCDSVAYPCMRMDEGDQVRLVKLLGPRLLQNGLTTQIFVHDHNWLTHRGDNALSFIKRDKRLPPIESVRRILGDLEAAQYITGTAWHCYAGSAADMAQLYDTLRREYPDKQIITSEISGWGLNRGQWWNEVKWIMDHNYLGTIQHFGGMCLQWNLALDHRAGPSPRKDSKAMGIVTINTDEWYVVFEREFYAMSHLAIAAPPGSVRVESGVRVDLAQHCQLSCAAFVQPDEKVSLVVLNSGETGEKFQVCAGDVQYTYELPGRSIVTLVW